MGNHIRTQENPEFVCFNEPSVKYSALSTKEIPLNCLGVVISKPPSLTLRGGVLDRHRTPHLHFDDDEMRTPK